MRARILRIAVICAVIAAQAAFPGPPAAAFSGFYVAKADARLFNKASKVVLAWDNGEAVLTMASDYESDLTEFAVVVPVPTVVTRDQIAIVPLAEIAHLDAYSAPRLVDREDPDPCAPRDALGRSVTIPAGTKPQPASPGGRFAGVAVEASYAVGEYDIAILSADESEGLVHYLIDHGYRVPDGAMPVLRSYLRQKMRFFVAKVALDRVAASGHRFIRPLQVRYDLPKLMLPIRLGTVNSAGPQDLVIFALTKRGRVETTNYRTVKMPSDITLPLYLKEEFGSFYKAMFDREVTRAGMHAVFLEYAWNLGSCDPCAADPMSYKELTDLGAGWVGGTGDVPFRAARGGRNAYVTRLHVRYDAEHFPEDLQLTETTDSSNFQSRYILRHPWDGEAHCSAGRNYRGELPRRFAKEAQDLAGLTGWAPRAIHARMQTSGEPFPLRDLD